MKRLTNACSTSSRTWVENVAWPTIGRSARSSDDSRATWVGREAERNSLRHFYDCYIGRDGFTLL